MLCYIVLLFKSKLLNLDFGLHFLGKLWSFKTVLPKFSVSCDKNRPWFANKGPFIQCCICKKGSRNTRELQWRDIFSGLFTNFAAIICGHLEEENDRLNKNPHFLLCCSNLRHQKYRCVGDFLGSACPHHYLSERSGLGFFGLISAKTRLKLSGRFRFIFLYPYLPGTLFCSSSFSSMIILLSLLNIHACACVTFAHRCVLQAHHQLIQHISWIIYVSTGWPPTHVLKLHILTFSSL